MNRSQTGSKAYLELTETLMLESPEFRKVWGRGEVFDPTEMCPSFEVVSPLIGEVSFGASTIVQSDSPRLLLIALIPVDQAGRERVELLHREPRAAIWEKSDMRARHPPAHRRLS